MIAEYFLVAILMHGTPNQQILVLERTPTKSACTRKSESYAGLGSQTTKFGCLTSFKQNII